MNYYSEVLKKYAVFSGRASRSEFWYFMLVSFFINLSINFIGVFGVPENVVSVINLLYAIVLFIPATAVMVRRLQDSNHNGWLILICLLPIIGAVVLVVLLCLDSDPATNQYGLNPKGIVAN